MKFPRDEFVLRMHIEFVGDDDGHGPMWWRKTSPYAGAN
jgi:hypothetical protein